MDYKSQLFTELLHAHTPTQAVDRTLDDSTQLNEAYLHLVYHSSWNTRIYQMITKRNVRQ